MCFSHIYVLNFTPDESFLLSGSADETVKIWSLESLGYFDCDNVTMPSLGPAFDHKFLDNNTSFIVATDETNSLRVLKDGFPLHHSPPESSLITCLSMCERGNVVSYGCQNGSVRLYYPKSGAIKSLGSHHSKIEAIDIALVVTGSNHEHEVVVTGSSDGMVKIWWNGGQVFHCEKKHSSLIQEVRTYIFSFMHVFAQNGVVLG